MNAGSQILINALSPDELVDLLRPMIREEIRQARSIEPTIVPYQQESTKKMLKVDIRYVS